MAYPAPFVVQVTPRQRIVVAMLVSVFIHLVLFLLPLEIANRRPSTAADSKHDVTIHLVRRRPNVPGQSTDSVSNLIPAKVAPPVPEERPRSSSPQQPVQPAATDQSNPEFRVLQEKDWRAQIQIAVKKQLDDNEKVERRRADMWQKTRSVMFAPTAESYQMDDDPLLPDLEFRDSRFAGFGVSLGESCYLGIPPMDAESALRASTLSPLLSCEFDL